MNQLIRNRLIGGAVLVFAGALFIPAILSPAAKTLDNPQLAIRIKGNQPKDTKTTIALLSTTPEEPVVTVEAKPVVIPPTVTKPKITANKPLALESLSDEVATQPQNSVRPSNATQAAVQTGSQSGKQKTNRLMPVALESIDTKSIAKTSKPSAAANQQRNSTAVSWLRVGSFSSQANAEKLATMLKSVNYPVKIERIAIGDKSFQRVLVGPFHDEKKMTIVMKSIQARGYTPSVQR